MAFVNKIAQYTGKNCEFEINDGLPYLTIYTDYRKSKYTLKEVGEDFLVIEFNEDNGNKKEYICPASHILVLVEKD